MKRDIEKDLLSWFQSTPRDPLLIRGARQVGKSYIIEQFAKQAAETCITINFELSPHLKKAFDTLEPTEIINSLQILLNINLKKRNTLLFLDEIQECPNAIMALRYFKELMPTFAIIGAGSLLEFAIRAPEFRMPVGRVQFLYLNPLSFGEFLDATGHDYMRLYLATVSLSTPITPIIHEQLLKLIRIYTLTGGMPAIIQSYTKQKDLFHCQFIQSNLLQTYRNDFGKYAKHVQLKHLHTVFNATPRFLGQRTRYVTIDPTSKSTDLQQAIGLLSLAELIHIQTASSANGLPLGAQTHERKFKLHFLDIGLAQYMCGLTADIHINKDLLQINSGAIAEQFVGQELLAYGPHYEQRTLYFWVRDKKNSEAEVDFLTVIDGRIFPIEVKAGKTGRLKSLKSFMDEKNSTLGIRISQEPLSLVNHFLSVPFYLIEQLPRLVRTS